MEWLSEASIVLALINLVILFSKKRKPTLTAACLRGIVFAQAIGGDKETQIRNACKAVMREDAGDNGKRDWPDQRIRQEVQALFSN